MALESSSAAAATPSAGPSSSSSSAPSSKDNKVPADQGQGKHNKAAVVDDAMEVDDEEEEEEHGPYQQAGGEAATSPRSEQEEEDAGQDERSANEGGAGDDEELEAGGSSKHASTANAAVAANSSKKSKKAPRQSAAGESSTAERAPGTTHLPFARVQRIIKADKEVQGVSREAQLMVSLATEHFIQQLVDQGSIRARLDKRKLITVKDLYVIPSTVPLSTALAARKRRLAHLAAVPDLGAATVIDTLPLASTVGSRNPELGGVLAKRAVKRGKTKNDQTNVNGGVVEGEGGGE